MQIGIDLGATKIESVLLKDNGLELHRNRIQSPKNYQKTINSLHSHRLINGISEDLYLSFGSTYLNDS